MNKKTRKDLKGLIGNMEGLKDAISNFAEIEQEKFDNLPEGIQDSETGVNLEESAVALEEVLVNFDEAIENIETAMQ